MPDLRMHENKPRPFLGDVARSCLPTVWQMTDFLPSAANNLEALAQAHEGEAFALLVEIVRDKEAKHDVRIKAAERILDQARGKPKVAQPHDPSRQKQKAVSMSVDTLMKIVQGAQARVAQTDQNRRQAEYLEGEFVPATRKRPVNEYQLASPAPTQPQPVVPGTKEIDDLLA
jgi:membrane-bound lytic murein transglycosylase B